MSDVPATLCWHCDRMLDAVDSLEGYQRPVPGAVSLCLYCGAVGTLDDELRMSKPSKELLDELEENEKFIKTYMNFAWARQYVMINASLMRPNREDNPDR